MTQDPVTELDTKMMARALELAARGRGHVEPNPMVGAVIVQGDQIVGEGFHERFGGPHAEINALAQAGPQARNATLYVTLEPCCHYGKTPPCTRAVIDAGISRVFAACSDPFPAVAGKGLQELTQAGVSVSLGLLEHDSRRLNAPYFKFRTTGLPFFTAKWAMTLDGKTATRTGDSRWVSSELSRRYVHQLRSLSDAVLVGVGTVLADDPTLTARIPDARNPRRIVVDTFARTPLHSHLIQTIDQAPLIIAVSESAPHERIAALETTGARILVLPLRDEHVALDALARELGRMELTNVLCEAGATLTAGLFHARLIDRVVVFLAAKLVGGQQAPGGIGGLGMEKMVDAILLHNLQVRTLDDDLVIEADVRPPEAVSV